MEPSSSTSAFPSVHLPVRSISFPSRIHPTSAKVEAALNHLRAWQVSPFSPSSPIGAEALQVGLIGLAELYTCLGDLVHSPQTKQALLHHKNGRLVEDVLDQSLIFLDICSTSRDILMVMKDHLQSLQSALRRRGGDSRIERDVDSYISSRKKAKKEIAKRVGELKTLQNKVGNFINVLDLEPQLQSVVKVIKEASNITISILKSLLLFLTVSSSKARASGWLKISKLIPVLLSSEKGKKIVTQVESVDIAVYSLQGQAVKNSDEYKAEVEVTQQMLGELSCSVDGFETGLDYLFRTLLKHRVTFLDILTQHY